MGLVSELTAQLMLGAARGWYRFDGPVRHGDDTRFWIRVGPQRRDYGLQAAKAWLDGHSLARTHPAQPRTVSQARLQQELQRVRAVLVAPGWVDTQRTAIRQAMQDADVTLAELARRAGPTPKAVSAAVRYGDPRTLSNVMMQKLLDALGVPVTVAYLPGVDQAGPVAPPGATALAREPAGLTIVRLLAYAHEQRLIRWVNPVDPNAGYRPATVFTLGYGSRRRQVGVAAVQPWLVGLADATAPDQAGLLAEA